MYCVRVFLGYCSVALIVYPPRPIESFRLDGVLSTRFSRLVVRLELAPICVAQSFLQHFAPFELHINIKTLLNTPPYEKYTFSERKLHEKSKYDIQKCAGGRVRMSRLRKSTFLDQIWNFPSCVLSPYPQPLLRIYHRIWIPYEIPLQKMYTRTGFELTIEKLLCLKKLVEFFCDIKKYQTCKFITDN